MAVDRQYLETGQRFSHIVESFRLPICVYISILFANLTLLVKFYQNFANALTPVAKKFFFTC